MARQRKYTNSSVISFRISDEELESLNRMVETLQIPRSDIIRVAFGIVVSSPVRSGEQNHHSVFPPPGTCSHAGLDGQRSS